MYRFGETHKEGSITLIIHIVWVIITFFTPKKDLGVRPDDLVFVFLDYITNFRKINVKYYPDLWIVLFKMKNYTDSVRLIYDENQKPISEEKEDEYMQSLYKLLESVSADRKTYKDFLNQKEWREHLTIEQIMILEDYSNGIEAMNGYWIIPHRRLFAQIMGLNGKDIKDKNKAQEDFVVLMIKLFSQEIRCFEDIYKYNFSEVYNTYKTSYLSSFVKNLSRKEIKKK